MEPLVTLSILEWRRLALVFWVEPRRAVRIQISSLPLCIQNGTRLDWGVQCVWVMGP